MKLVNTESFLTQAATRLQHAAATGDIGRTYPEIEMITPAHDTVRDFLRSVQIACEAIADGAAHAATSCTKITLTFDGADTHLAHKAS